MSIDNQCRFVGRLAAPPEQLGPTGVKFRLGTDYWNGQTKQKDTVWIPCVAWGKDADLMKRFGTTGRQLAVEGQYKPREYDAPGPNGPQKRLDPQFVIREIKLLAESSKQGPSNQSDYNTEQDEAEPVGYRW